MKFFARLMGFVIFFGFMPTLIADTVKQDESYQIGSKFSLNSNILGEQREFYVSLPPSYDQTTDTYPVLIVLDGAQNIEHVVSSTRMLSRWKGVPETIVVAIPSKNRVRDFTPTKDTNYSLESGGAANFGKFIEDEVMSFVDQKYRTHPYRILKGHSLSGLFAANQILTNNPFYSAYIIVAPALWWDGEYAINEIQDFKPAESSTPINAFFGIGSLDGYGMKNELSRFYDGLVKTDIEHSHLSQEIFENEGHMSATLLSAYYGVEHVFSKTKYDNTQWANFSSESFLNFIENTQKVYGSNVSQTGELYFELASFLVGKQNYEGAITVMKTNIAEYPNYPFNHETLADIYALNDQTSMAINEYQKAAQAARNSGSFGDGVAKKYERAIELLRNPIIIAESQLTSFAGCYVSESGSAFRFNVENGQLIGSRENWNNFRLFADSSESFFTRADPKLSLAFEEKSVAISAYGAPTVFEKRSCD